MTPKEHSPQAEPKKFWIEVTLVTVGAKLETMYKVYLQKSYNAASNEYHHGDIYFNVIEISAMEALKKELEAAKALNDKLLEKLATKHVLVWKENSILKQQLKLSVKHRNTLIKALIEPIALDKGDIQIVILAHNEELAALEAK